jgi:hypothetical protein
VKRGKADLRNATYVVLGDRELYTLGAVDALPFDSARVRTKLVGFLLHPIARSATWRRLLSLQILAVLGSWRGTILTNRFHLADVSIWGIENIASTTSSV